MKSSPSRAARWMVALLAAGLALSFYDPPYLKTQLLNDIPMIVVLPLLFAIIQWSWLKPSSIACLVVFWGFHVYASRFMYIHTPGGEAMTWLALGDEHTGRNHFDRWIHLAFGVLYLFPICDRLDRNKATLRGYSTFVAIALIGFASAIYEVFEWLLTVVAAGPEAHRYNGQQGDAWDAQKDMALALIGAFAVSWLRVFWPKKTAPSRP